MYTPAPIRALLFLVLGIPYFSLGLEVDYSVSDISPFFSVNAGCRYVWPLFTQHSWRTSFFILWERNDKLWFDSSQGKKQINPDL